MIKSMQQDAGFPEFLNFSSVSNSSYYSFPASSRIVDFTETQRVKFCGQPCEIKRKIKHFLTTS